MLHIVCSYALDASNSFIMVYGESHCPSKIFAEVVYSQEMHETDEIYHMGVLRYVMNSTVSHTSEQSTTGRSVSFTLNAIGSIFECLHPVTSYRLYSTLLCSMGSELWSLTKNGAEHLRTSSLNTIHGSRPSYNQS